MPFAVQKFIILKCVLSFSGVLAKKTTPSPTSGASSADAFLLRCSVYASTTESGLHMVSDKDMTVFPAQFVEVTVPFLSSDPGTLVGKGFQPWL